MRNGYSNEFPNHQTHPRSGRPPLALADHFRTSRHRVEARSTSPSPRLRPPGRPQPRSSAIGLVKSATSRRKAPHPFHGTIAATNGEIIWAVRCSSERTIQCGASSIPAERRSEHTQTTSGSSSSSPRRHRRGVWNEVPEFSWRHSRARARRGATVPTQDARRYRCLSPEVPPACRRSCPRLGVRPLHATDRAGETRPAALISPTTAVRCRPLRCA
jgi:hypothetical protein